MTPALKEWSAAVHALLDGRQTVLLRKGGIHEKRFEVTAREFLLFPTVAHSHAERVRPEHRDLLAPAAADSTDDHLVLRAAAKVVAAVEVDQTRAPRRHRGPAHLDRRSRCAPTGWTSGPKHRLTVLVVAGAPARASRCGCRAPGYAGCKSWVDAARRPETGRTRCTMTATLAGIAERVRRSVG